MHFSFKNKKVLIELLVRPSNMVRYRYKYVVVRMELRVSTAPETEYGIPPDFEEVNLYDQKYVKYILVNQSVAYTRPHEGPLHHQDYLSFFRCPLPEMRQ